MSYMITAKIKCWRGLWYAMILENGRHVHGTEHASPNTLPAIMKVACEAIRFLESMRVPSAESWIE